MKGIEKVKWHGRGVEQPHTMYTCICGWIE